MKYLIREQAVECWSCMGFLYERALYCLVRSYIAALRSRRQFAGMASVLLGERTANSKKIGEGPQCWWQANRFACCKVEQWLQHGKPSGWSA